MVGAPEGPFGEREPHVTRWLVTGAGGMLGRDLVEALAGDTVTALSRAELDVTDPEAVAEAVAAHDVVVNAAAWTDVDAAEADEEAATRVNAGGPAALAAACGRHAARLLHVSTDYVFDGSAVAPYPEGAPVAPLSAYGRGKAAGEAIVLAALPESGYVVRSAWLYARHGRSFVRTMVRLERETETVDVVDDQRGQPTWSADLAVGLVALGRLAVHDGAPAGVYHATSQGETTWCGLARAVFEEVGADPERVRTTTSAQFPRPAPRPAYGVLGHERWAAAGLPPLPHWRDGLRHAMSASLSRS